MSKKVTNLTKKSLTALFSLFLVFNIFAQEISSDEAVIAAGEATFKANCTQCHQVHKQVIGPALESVYERRSIEWLQSWIKNSQKMIADGDEQAVALYDEYKTDMPSYPFSDDQVMELLAYIQAETVKGPPVVDDPATGGGEGEATESVSSSYLMAVIIILVVVLALALVALAIAATTLTKYLRERKDLDEEEEELVNQSFDLIAFAKSNYFLGLIAFIFTALILKTLIDGAFTIGVQQGYQPTQPIAF